MIKYIQFVLSEYYYEILAERVGEIQAKVESHQVQVLLSKALKEVPGTEGGLKGDKQADDRGNASGGCVADRGISMKDTLIIADEPETIQSFLQQGWYVVVLYHEKNKDISIPKVRYGVEDVFMLEYRSYEEAYRRLAGLPWDILETDRLKVRESTVEDVNEFYRIYEEPSITFYMEDLYKEKEAEQAYMRAYIDQVYGFYGYGLWTVILKSTDEVIGRAGLSVREGYELPELGFVIDVFHQHQGYGYEVCSAILRYAREELEFGKIQAMVKEKNQKSRRLLTKLGFVFERDVIEVNRNYKLFVKNL